MSYIGAKPAEQILSSADIQDGAISTVDLANGAITQAKLANGVAGTGPAFSAYAGSGANISNSTWTKITLDTEVYDTNSNFASSRFTPTVAGYYQINFTSTSSASNNNSYWNYNAIYKNGSAYIGTYSVFPSGNIQNYSNNLSQLIYMNGSSDYLEFYVNVYVGSGTPSYAGGAGTTLASGYLARAA